MADGDDPIFRLLGLTEDIYVTVVSTSGAELKVRAVPEYVLAPQEIIVCIAVVPFGMADVQSTSIGPHPPAVQVQIVYGDGRAIQQGAFDARAEYVSAHGDPHEAYRNAAPTPD